MRVRNNSADPPLVHLTVSRHHCCSMLSKSIVNTRTVHVTTIDRALWVQTSIWPRLKKVHRKEGAFVFVFSNLYAVHSVFTHQITFVGLNSIAQCNYENMVSIISYFVLTTFVHDAADKW